MSRFVEWKKQTDKYRAALEALRVLAQENWDDAERACAEFMAEPWEAAMKTKGITQRRTGHVCLSRLKGERRCPNNWSHACNSPHCIPGHDHSSEWVKEGKTHAIVCQPYGMSYEVLKQAVSFCEANGLRVDIDAYLAWHFPGRCLRVTYRPGRKEGVGDELVQEGKGSHLM